MDSQTNSSYLELNKKKIEKFATSKIILAISTITFQVIRCTGATAALFSFSVKISRDQTTQ